MSIIKRTLFVLLIVATLPVSVANAQSDSVGVANDQEKQLSTGHVPFIRSFSLFADIGKPAMRWLDTEKKLEGGLQIVSGHGIALEGAYGVAKLQPEQVIENGTYRADGSYLRGSIGYQWVIKDINTLQLMAGYGISSFDDQGSILVSSEIWDDYEAIYSRQDLSASWAEIALLTETRVARFIYAGMALRLRYLIDHEDFEEFPVLSVPGYGYAFNTTTPALNIYLRIKLPE